MSPPSHDKNKTTCFPPLNEKKKRFKNRSSQVKMVKKCCKREREVNCTLHQILNLSTTTFKHTSHHIFFFLLVLASFCLKPRDSIKFLKPFKPLSQL